MMPPCCALCDQDLDPSDEGGGLLTFSLSAEQLEFNKRFEAPGFVGHPKGTHWFCGAHMQKARQLCQRYHDDEGLRLMGLHFQREPEVPDAAAQILAVMRSKRITLAANKEYFGYLVFEGAEFIYVSGDTLAPHLEERSACSDEEAFRLAKGKLVDTASRVYHVALARDTDVLRFLQLYPFWFS